MELEPGVEVEWGVFTCNVTFHVSKSCYTASQLDIWDKIVRIFGHKSMYVKILCCMLILSACFFSVLFFDGVLKGALSLYHLLFLFLNIAFVLDTPFKLANCCHYESKIRCACFQMDFFDFHGSY